MSRTSKPFARWNPAALRRLALLTALLAGVESALVHGWYWAGFLRGNLRGPDFFSFYAAARLFTTRGGAAVYELGQQKQFQDLVTAHWGGHFLLLPYIHPPYYTLLIAPLAAFDYRQAYLAWTALNLALLALVLLLLVRTADLSKLGAAAALLLSLGFLPVFATLLQGQSDLVMLLPLAGAYVAWNRGRPGWAGVLSGLALAKPHLLLVLPLLFIARREWRALGGFAAVAVGLGLVSVLSAGLAGASRYVKIVGSWAVGGGDIWPITNQTVYSLRGALENLPGGRFPALGLLLVLLLLIGLSLAWRPDVPRLDFAVAIAASVALSPYQNLHDLSLLLIPGFAIASLLQRGRLRWPVAGAGTLAVAYAGINLTLGLGAWSAALGVLLMAAYLTVERLAVRPAPVPLPRLEWSGPRPHRVIVLPAYRAAKTLKDVVEQIPPGHADRVLLVDDASSDATVSVANALSLDVIRHPQNLGYGGNQKTCYAAALEMGADVVVMLHPDNQYNPALIPALCEVIERGEADIVLGSRWLNLNPREAGMPWWKRAGNRFLTGVENRVLGLKLSEYHTGYRAYSRRFLETVPFTENADDFVFDSQVLIQAAAFGFRIGEVPATGRYFEDMSSVGFRTSVEYGLETLLVLARYVLHRAGFHARWLTPRHAGDAATAVAAAH